MSEWISTKTELPDDLIDVLICYGNEKYYVAQLDFYRESKAWYANSKFIDVVNSDCITHWFKLPEPPKPKITKYYANIYPSSYHGIKIANAYIDKEDCIRDQGAGCIKVIEFEVEE